MLKAREEAEVELRTDILEFGLDAFPPIVVAPDLDYPGIVLILAVRPEGPSFQKAISWRETA